MSFIHFRLQTTYSLSEGAVRLKPLLKACHKMNMPAVAITDSGNLFGSLEFTLAALSEGIQPIIGCNIPIIDEMSGDSATFSRPEPDEILLIAKNQEGYNSLQKIVSHAWLNPACSKVPSIGSVIPAKAGIQSAKDLDPRFRGDDNGLTAIIGKNSRLHRHLLAGNHELTKKHLLEMRELFGDDLFIELMRHNLPDQIRIEEELIDLAYEFSLPLLATNDVYFIEPEMYEAHDALLCIADGRYVTEDNRKKVTREHYLKSPQQMRELFADIPEAVDNSLYLARKCSGIPQKRPPILPSFADDEEAEFRRQAREGLKWRLENFVTPSEGDIVEALNQQLTTNNQQLTTHQTYWDRLELELDIISSMKFAGYFLIVSDFIKWSKANNIPVGPGRGSGAGSIAAWALQITDIDPLRYGLLFERFLNPERVSMPDFDIDFCQERREEVIEYVRSKYGNDKVAQIITFGKLQARVVLRDVGRVLQMPYGQVDRICKLVPVNPANPVDLTQAIELEPMLKKSIQDDAQVAKLVDIGLKLEGLNRHASTHAAGVVIGDRPLDELVPLYLDQKSDMPVVQYSMKYAEEAGLVKFDFLGLKTLTVLSKAVELVARRGIKIDLLKLPENDPITYEMLGRGDSAGVFQIESSGMRDVLRKMKPDCLEDIIALVSLYRPGPMDNIPTYIKRKHGEEKPDYPHPLIEDILKETYGVIIYQEQVMQIAQVLAGYSLGGADLLRRAMGKKIKAEMDAQRQIFIDGAVKNGVKDKKAGEIFDLIAKFASYGFNKSHAAAYALISYQTAYMKAHYPVEFYAATMTLDLQNTDKLASFANEGRKNGVQFLPPNINESGVVFDSLVSGEWLVVNGKWLVVRWLVVSSLIVNGCFFLNLLYLFNNEIKPNQPTTNHSPITTNLPTTNGVYYSLAALKGVSPESISSIIKERDKNGKFKNIEDFLQRVPAKALNKRQMESLIKAGVFDCLEPNRRKLFDSLDIISKYHASLHEINTSSQNSLFGDDEGDKRLSSLLDVADWPTQEKLQYEMEAVGFYLSSHPLDSYIEYLQKQNITPSSEFENKLGTSLTPIKAAGVLVARKIKASAKGRFAFLTMSDSAGLFEITIYNEDLLNRIWENMSEGSLLIIRGVGKKEEGSIRIIADNITHLKEDYRPEYHNLSIKLKDIKVLQQLKETLGNEITNGANVSLSIGGYAIEIAGKYAIDSDRKNQILQMQGVELSS